MLAFLNAVAWITSTQGVHDGTQAADKSLESSEIVVTGERVARSLRKTPSSVFVVTADDVEAQAGSDRLDDILAQVPNIQFGSGNLGPTIRGQDTTGSLQDLPALLGGNRYEARDKAYSTRSWRAGATAYREVGRMTWFAGVELGGLKADERLQLLPEVRTDKLLRVQLGAIHRQFTFAGFAPVTRLVIERNRSSVEFYDYRRTRTEIGISRAF